MKCQPLQLDRLTVGCKLTNNECRENLNSLYGGGLAVLIKSRYSSVAGSPSANIQVAKLGLRWFPRPTRQS